MGRLRRHIILCAGQFIGQIAADTISLLSVGLGWILLVLGLLLMFANAGLLSSNSAYLVSGVTSIVGQLPGIPVYAVDLATTQTTLFGIVIWTLGLDVLLVGLGLWVRHRLARWVAAAIFGLAAFFDFAQFLLLGLLGAPVFTLEFIVNTLILYALFKREIWVDK
jgi:hypothetical protein